jgi:hypothetical protein
VLLVYYIIIIITNTVTTLTRRASCTHHKRRQNLICNKFFVRYTDSVLLQGGRPRKYGFGARAREGPRMLIHRKVCSVVEPGGIVCHTCGVYSMNLVPRVKKMVDEVRISALKFLFRLQHLLTPIFRSLLLSCTLTSFLQRLRFLC